jgi:hypothetical protein
MQRGEWSAVHLHQPSALPQRPDPYRRESDPFKQLVKVRVGGVVVARVEEHLAAGVVSWIRRNVRGVERVEGFDDACAGDERRDLLTAGLLAKVSDLSGGDGELIGGVNYDPPVPVR